MELKPCPCGKTPKEVLIYGEDRDKWAFAYGDCCGDWHVEFRMHYLNVGSKEARKLAAEAWNEAPRTDKSPREERLEKALLAIMSAAQEGGTMRDIHSIAREALGEKE